MNTPVLDRQLKAIASRHRLLILDWLKSPAQHFRPQIDGDLIDDGVCALLIGEKLGLAQPTTAQHLRLLVDAGFLIPKRIKKWTFYKRNEVQIATFKSIMAEQI